MTELGSEHVAKGEAAGRRPDSQAAVFDETTAVTLDQTRRAAAETRATLLDETRSTLLDARAAARYWWISPLARGRRVLDAGCGLGLGSAVLAEVGAEEVIGVDRAAAVLELARSSRMPANLRLQCDELERLPLPDSSFDLVVCFDVIRRQEDVKNIIESLLRVAAPGGMLVTSYHNTSLADEARSILRQRLGNVSDFRQYDILTGAIIDDETSDVADLAPVEGMVIRKAAHCEPGTETDVIVVATDSSANMPGMAAVLCNPQDVYLWVRQAEAQERAIKELKAAILQLKAKLTERDQLLTELRTAEQMLAMRVSRYQESQEGVEAASLRTALDYQRTLSWRVTGPLRATGGLLKRVLGSRRKVLRKM
jgi:2-polyprenyl-3-methyl-5-hydroxy-6-metoxy-1,4-benzoquinol methylase